MVIHPEAARRFLKGYSILLAEVHHLSGDTAEIEMMNMLHRSRAAIVHNPSLIEAAALSLEADGHAVPEDVLEAIQSLKVKNWIFLRDTPKYSILIDPDGKDAYLVRKEGGCDATFCSIPRFHVRLTESVTGPSDRGRLGIGAVIRRWEAAGR